MLNLLRCSTERSTTAAWWRLGLAAAEAPANNDNLVEQWFRDRAKRSVLCLQDLCLIALHGPENISTATSLNLYSKNRDQNLIRDVILFLRRQTLASCSVVRIRLSVTLFYAHGYTFCYKAYGSTPDTATRKLWAILRQNHTPPPGRFFFGELQINFDVEPPLDVVQQQELEKFSHLLPVPFYSFFLESSSLTLYNCATAREFMHASGRLCKDHMATLVQEHKRGVRRALDYVIGYTKT